MKKLVLALMVLFTCAPLAFAGKVAGVVISSTSLPYSTNIDMDVSELSRFSVQMVVSTESISAHSGTLGQRSTAQITISDWTKLFEKRASVTVTIASNSTTALDNHYLTLNGVSFTEGVNWDIGATSAATANSMCAAIDAHPSFMASTTSAGVFITSATNTGTYANGWIVYSSTAAAISISSGLFSGGQPNAVVQVLGVTLTQGSDWTAATSSGVTARSLSEAMNANATIIAVFRSTDTGFGVINSSVNVYGAYDYPISVSTPAISVANGGFCCGATGALNHLSDVFTNTSHGFTTGLKVQFNGTASTYTAVIPPLVGGATYYAIKVNDNSYKLAYVSTDAIAGLGINISSPTSTGGSFALTPVPLALGSAGYRWAGSNDGTNFVNHTTMTTNVISHTYATPTSVLHDFGQYPYKHLRFIYTGPTSGGITIRGHLLGEPVK